MSSAVVSDDAEGEPGARYLRYAGYFWLLSAGMYGLLIAVQVRGGIAVVATGAGFAVGVPLLVYYGLRRRSRAAWFAHMGLSLLGAVSIFGLLGLYFGWKGRRAAGVYWRTDEPRSDGQAPSPSTPTASRSPRPASSSTTSATGDGVDGTEHWGDDGPTPTGDVDAETDWDEDDRTEYWSVDDGPSPTSEWGEED